MKTKIRSVGNSHGIIIPRELLREWGLCLGDEIEIDSDGFRPLAASSVHERLDRLKLEISLRVLSKFGVDKVRRKSLENLERWERLRPLAPPYQEWRTILTTGDDALLLGIMIGHNDNSNRLRQSFPYVGMLPKAELAKLRDQV